MAEFPLDFPVVFTVNIIINRLRYIIESCQSFQTVLFSGLRNISLQILDSYANPRLRLGFA